MKATYLAVDDIGADFVRLFEDGVTIGDAISILRVKHGTEAGVLDALGNLLVDIETRGFYQNAQITEDVLDSLTMLARLTNRCNLRCTHCLVSSAPDWPTAHDLDTAAWCSTLDGYASFARDNQYSFSRATFTGGEALTRLDCFDILSHSKSLGLRTELFTNGVLIANSRIAIKLSSVVDEVQVSFDGATPHIHDYIRGAGMFERTLRGVRLLLEANVRFRLAVVVMPHNYRDLMENLPGLIRSIPAKFQVKLGLAVNEGRANESMLFPSLLEAEQKLKELVNHMCREGVSSERPLISNLKTITCGFGRELTVDSNGLVYGCGPQQHPIGDLKVETFRSVADRTVGKARAAEVDFVEGCRECDIRYVCGGVCRLNNISRMGSPVISSCDRANKERNILKLFGRSADVVPLNMLTNSRPPASGVHTAGVPGGLVPLSLLTGTNAHKERSD